MAYRTDPRAKQVHGSNPQFLIDKITRQKIYNDPYTKEHCFALTAETLIDKAVQLKYVGGTYGGNRRPTKFLCLLLKMLQIQPDEDIILELIKNKDYKYIRLLGMVYFRMVCQKHKDIYMVLEPLYADYRKINFRETSGQFKTMHIDEVVDNLLRDERFCEVMLPRIQKRYVLEQNEVLPGPRVSPLELEGGFQEEGKEAATIEKDYAFERDKE